MVALQELFKPVTQEPGRLIDVLLDEHVPEPERHRRYQPGFRYADDVERYVWSEELHPRGQPENKGEFARVPSSGATATQPQPQPQQPAQQEKHPNLIQAEMAHAAAKQKYAEVTSVVEQAMIKARLAVQVEMRPDELRKEDAALVEPKSDAEVPAYLEAVHKHKHVKAAMLKLQMMAEQIHADVTYFTKKLYSNPDGTYLPERQAIHTEIANKTITDDTRALAGQRPQIVFVIGPPASGKSTAGASFVQSHGVKFLSLSSDDVKAKLKEYAGWDAAALHEESGDVLRNDIMPRALREKHNIIMDVVGDNTERTMFFAKQFSEEGYDVHVVQVKVPEYKTVHRLSTRFLENSFGRNPSLAPGRWVPPEYALGLGPKVDATYAAMKNAPFVSSGVQLDNDVPIGTTPRTIDQWKR